MDDPFETARKQALGLCGLSDKLTAYDRAVSTGLKIDAASRGLTALQGTEALSRAVSGVAGSDTLSKLVRGDLSLHKGIAARANVGTLFADKLMMLPKPLTLADHLGKLNFPSIFAAQNALGELNRAGHWASSIGAMRESEISKMFRKSEVASQQFLALKSSFAFSDLAKTQSIADHIGKISAAGLLGTSHKLSLFAGATDVFGPSAVGSQVAFDALLGTYRSTPQLPASFFRDRDARAKAYREADVDEGLIDADTAATVEVMVESGIAVGHQTRHGNLVAVMEVGASTMRVKALQARAGTYALIDGLEAELRKFIALKLSAVVRDQDGEEKSKDWFKRRVPGVILAKAKERRQAARLAGEPFQPLIEFVELGDLITIITRTDNWGDAFEVVFRNMAHLRVDLERLIAVRRPIAHGRAIDAVQVAEIFLVASRIKGWMLGTNSDAEDWDGDA